MRRARGGDIVLVGWSKMREIAELNASSMAWVRDKACVNINRTAARRVTGGGVRRASCRIRRK